MTDSEFNIEFSEDQFRDQIEFFRGKLRSIPSKISTLRIDEYAERNRIMPVGSPRPGPWDNSYTPYLIEPQQNLSPTSDIQHEISMKGAQGGWTAIAENMICYYMDEVPADTLFVSATGGLLERWASRRLEPAIDSCGLRSKITTATVLDSKTRKTGDKVYSKEINGVRLDMASARSSPSLAATDKRILIRDEIDRAPALLTTGEGSWLKVSFARTNFWASRRKVYDLGTPTLEGTSQINELYKLGDKRKFLVPCPRCGVFQELVFGSEDTQHGLKPETKAGELIDAHYICEHCHDAFFNNEKYTFLGLGYWEPTSKSSDPTLVSRHWSSLYAPIGALDWKEIWRKYLEALDDPLGGMQTFVNLYLGLPYKPQGVRPQKIISGGHYKRGTVPDGVLFLTIGVDVQAGKKSDKKKPARLELEICGHGIGYRTWSIDYKIIEGKVTDPFDGAWRKLKEMFLNGDLEFKREDGIPIGIKMVLIDCNFLPEVVYAFCASGFLNVFPARGFKLLTQRKDEATDEETVGDLKRFRWSKSGEQGYYTIATVFYKKMLYHNLMVPRQNIGPQKPGFCDFPIDYDPEYYKQLTAEEMRIDEKTQSVSFWKPDSRPNEALDVRVLNLAASHIFLKNVVDAQRDAAKKNGVLKTELEKIGASFILHQMQDNLDRRIQQVRKNLLKK